MDDRKEREKGVRDFLLHITLRHLLDESETEEESKSGLGMTGDESEKVHVLSVVLWRGQGQLLFLKLRSTV